MENPSFIDEFPSYKPLPVLNLPGISQHAKFDYRSVSIGVEKLDMVQPHELLSKFVAASFANFPGRVLGELYVVGGWQAWIVRKSQTYGVIPQMANNKSLR